MGKKMILHVSNIRSFFIPTSFVRKIREIPNASGY